MSRRYYAVQVGDYFFDDIGSTRKREAFRIARREARENPGMEVRVVTRTVDDDFTLDVTLVQEGRVEW